MKRTILFITILLMSVSATKAQSALDLNDKLASITDSLYARGQGWGAAFNTAYKSGNYSSLSPVSSGLTTFINKKIEYVQSLKDIKNSKPLRMALLDLLNFEKRMVIEGFKPFEKFTADTPQETIKAALDALTEKSKEEGLYLKKMVGAQQTYATENGFKIETEKTEETLDKK